MTHPELTPRDSAREIPSMLATLASYEGLFGPYHPQTLGATLALAAALCASGSRVDGKQLLERAMADLTRHQGRHHPLRIRALELWSTLLREEGRWTLALLAQQELLECRIHLLGREHPDSLAARNMISSTLADSAAQNLQNSPGPGSPPC